MVILAKRLRDTYGCGEHGQPESALQDVLNKMIRVIEDVVKICSNAFINIRVDSFRRVVGISNRPWGRRTSYCLWYPKHPLRQEKEQIP